MSKGRNEERIEKMDRNQHRRKNLKTKTNKGRKGIADNRKYKSHEERWTKTDVAYKCLNPAILVGSNNCDISSGKQGVCKFDSSKYVVCKSWRCISLPCVDEGITFFRWWLRCKTRINTWGGKLQNWILKAFRNAAAVVEA